jgi:hypothetical protein
MSENYRQVEHPVFTFGVFLLVLGWVGCCCSVDDLGGDESASPAKTAEVCGEKGGSTAMASMSN